MVLEQLTVSDGLATRAVALAWQESQVAVPSTGMIVGASVIEFPGSLGAVNAAGHARGVGHDSPIGLGSARAHRGLRV
jgi:hypothetical protein